MALPRMISIDSLPMLTSFQSSASTTIPAKQDATRAMAFRRHADSESLAGHAAKQLQTEPPTDNMAGSLAGRPCQLAKRHFIYLVTL